MSEYNSPDGLPDHEPRMTPTEVERTGVVAYLRRRSADSRKRAASLRADTAQNASDAEKWEFAAQALAVEADQIEAGRHWR